MIRLIDASGVHHPLTAYTDYHIKHKMDGCDTMSFCVDIGHSQYPLLQEECRILTESNDWLIKKIDDDKIDCELNFDFLKTKVYAGYRSETRSLTEVLLSHLPEGWTIEGANVATIRRTIEFDFCTDFDVIYACMSTYKVYFVWHILQKRLVVYDPTKMQPTGEYVTSELNLKSLSFKGESTDFATRLYAYGADGMTMEDAVVDDGNGNMVRYGKPYVENRTYADKTVCAYWSDERYTIPEELYAAALENLAALAWPVRAYECDVVDLAKQDPRYTFLDFSMHKKITLIDIDRHIKVEHQIVEYDEWPGEESENKVTLSCVPGTIQSSMKQIAAGAVEEFQKNTTEFDRKIAMATAMLTGVFGGHVMTNGSEIFIMDTDDPATAKVVWRWNINGIGKSSTGIDGPYTSALTFDDTFITNVIQAMVIRGSLIEADSIQGSSINQSYTDDVLQQSFEASEGLVRAAFEQISGYLTNDENTGQLDILRQNIADLQATIDGLTLDFTETYSGGINYVINSAGLNGVSEEWEYDGTVVSLQNEDTKNATVANSCFRLSGGASLRQTIDNIIAGNSYSVSLKVKKTGNLLAMVKVLYNGGAEALVYSSSSAGGWTEYTCTIQNLQSNTIELQITARDDFLYIADIMVCEGTVPRPWTPAPNEMYTSGTRIDKTGVVVYRGEDQRTAITNTEFAGYYHDIKVFSLNKDETYMRKTTIDGELAVGACKFIPYEGASDSGLNITLID